VNCGSRRTSNTFGDGGARKDFLGRDRDSATFFEKPTMRIGNRCRHACPATRPATAVAKVDRSGLDRISTKGPPPATTRKHRHLAQDHSPTLTNDFLQNSFCMTLSSKHHSGESHFAPSVSGYVLPAQSCFPRRFLWLGTGSRILATLGWGTSTMAADDHPTGDATRRSPTISPDGHHIAMSWAMRYLDRRCVW